MITIPILYHSGVGSTKFVAETLAKGFAKYAKTVLESVENPNAYKIVSNSQYLVLGFPTYHSAPSATMANFIQSLPVFTSPKLVFAFTTCGLYSTNTLRIFSKLCQSKNLYVVTYSSYRAPASDGSLLLPQLPFWFHFEPKLKTKITRDLHHFLLQTKRGTAPFKAAPPKHPPIKLYSPLNYPNKLAGQASHLPIYWTSSPCNHCGLCIRRCPSGALAFNQDNNLIHNRHNCQHCYRCIHYCPQKALSLSKKHPPAIQLNSTFWKSKQKEYSLKNREYYHLLP